MNSSSSSGFAPIALVSAEQNPNVSNIQNNTIISTPPTEMAYKPFNNNASNDRRSRENNNGKPLVDGRALPPLRPRRSSEVKNYDEASRRFCTNYNCRTRHTPMWRKGPLGPKVIKQLQFF